MLDRILIGSSAEPTDTNFKNVTLLLHGDGSNGAQNNTFIDSSTNNFTITRNGNTTQGSFSPYGSNWSNYFDGSGDWLSLSDSDAFSMGSGDFTAEAWIYPTSLANEAMIMGQWSGDTGSTTLNWALMFSSGSTGYLRLITSSNGSGVLFDLSTSSTSFALSTNTWYHIAAVRNGNTFTIYVDGTSRATTTNSSSLYNATNAFTIGAESNTQAQYFTGYISNARIVKGTAVYTSAFTPPTQPLTAITNTSLLTCADNRFRDGSTNNFTITRNGDVKVTNFAPFAPSSAYSTTTNGGSIYFDTDDYLNTAFSSAFSFGSGDFTWEAWVFPQAGFDAYFISFLGEDDSWAILGNTGGSGRLQYLDYFDLSLVDGTSSLQYNAWNHIAVTRSSGTVRLYNNGVLLASGTGSRNYTANNKAVIGARPDGYSNRFKHMSDVRILKGTALYTGSTYTVPTSPVSAVTNTQLLLKGQNAAIFDNSMKNDLETVGNAQISTSVKKFGTGSIYFDGSGDYLAIPFSDQMKFGTGDFTIEFWIYPTADSGDWFPVSSIGNLGFFFGRRSSGGWGYGITGSAWEYSSGTNPTLNTWQHVAISRSGTSIRIFVNGTQVGTTQTSGSDYSLATGGTSIGSQGANYYVTGYMDEVRITKGVARYTANFTAPTAPFPNK